jgi:hypothetical protein
MTKLNRLLPWPIILSFLLLMSATAFAGTDPPTPDADTAAWLRALFTAVTAKEWTPAVGLVLLGLAYLGRRWGGALIPWFRTTFGGIVMSFGIALAGTIGVVWAAGGHVTVSLVFGALTTGTAAGLFWEWLKKKFPGAQLPDPPKTSSSPGAA